MARHRRKRQGASGRAQFEGEASIPAQRARTRYILPRNPPEGGAHRHGRHHCAPKRPSKIHARSGLRGTSGRTVRRLLRPLWRCARGAILWAILWAIVGWIVGWIIGASVWAIVGVSMAADGVPCHRAAAPTLLPMLRRGSLCLGAGLPRSGYMLMRNRLANQPPHDVLRMCDTHALGIRTYIIWVMPGGAIKAVAGDRRRGLGAGVLKCGCDAR
jgi:hypothetical protein